jgi:hypothetical protein
MQVALRARCNGMATTIKITVNGKPHASNI